MKIDSNDYTWLKKVPVYPKCPHCNKGQLDRRVKRGFLVKNVFIWMNVKRYQCNTCNRKTYLKITRKN